MKLFLITMNDCGPDSFDSFVVAAKSKDDAARFLQEEFRTDAIWKKGYEIERITEDDYKSPELILGSFNPGPKYDKHLKSK